ncbi:Protein of unknown function [Gryllus bimaculatus]|nr:Protein of unknown function [Gryllus bimaculatus]
MRIKIVKCNKYESFALEFVTNIVKQFCNIVKQVILFHDEAHNPIFLFITRTFDCQNEILSQWFCRLRNDSGLSPLKGPREWNGEIHELESLESTGKSTFGIRPQVSSSMFRGAEDEEWKGWRSSISFSQQHCCPLVRITEGSKVSEVLVMDEDLVDGECKILEKRNGYKLKRSKLKSSVLGTCESGSGKKSCEEENFELKEKLQELFEDTGELHNFCECIDFSVSSPQFQTHQNKPFIRKLNFSGGEIDVPSTSNCSVGASRERSDPNVCSNCVHDTKKFLGFSDGARFLSQNYARVFLDFYDIQNGITM